MDPCRIYELHCLAVFLPTGPVSNEGYFLSCLVQSVANLLLLPFLICFPTTLFSPPSPNCHIPACPCSFSRTLIPFQVDFLIVEGATHLNDNRIPKPESACWRVVSSKRRQQLVVPPPSADGSQLSLSIKRLQTMDPHKTLVSISSRHPFFPTFFAPFAPMEACYQILELGKSKCRRCKVATPCQKQNCRQRPACN